MKAFALLHHLKFAAVFASATFALSASAQNLPDSRIIEVPGHAAAQATASSTLSIELPVRARYMSPADFRRFAGVYELSNGDTLNLRRSGAVMYARIGNQPEHRIIASSATSFVALNRQLKVRIDHHDDGSVGGELVMMVPSRQLADGTQSAPAIAALGFPAP